MPPTHRYRNALALAFSRFLLGVAFFQRSYCKVCVAHSAHFSATGMLQRSLRTYPGDAQLQGLGMQPADLRPALQHPGLPLRRAEGRGPVLLRQELLGRWTD